MAVKESMDAAFISKSIEIITREMIATSPNSLDEYDRTFSIGNNSYGQITRQQGPSQEMIDKARQLYETSRYLLKAGSERLVIQVMQDTNGQKTYSVNFSGESGGTHGS